MTRKRAFTIFLILYLLIGACGTFLGLMKGDLESDSSQEILTIFNVQ